MLVEVGGGVPHLLQISEIFEFLSEASTSDYLIVGGLIFLFIAIAGNISDIEPGKTGRIVGGVAGTVLLVTGLVLTGGVGSDTPSTPTATVDTDSPTTASPESSELTTTVPDSPTPPTTTTSRQSPSSPETPTPSVTSTPPPPSIRSDVGRVNAPVTVFLGEKELDVSDVITGSGSPVGTGNVVLIGNSGDADGGSTTIDGDTADFTESNGFTTGGYRLSDTPSDRRDFTVREARVTDVTLEDADTGSEITDGSISDEQVVVVLTNFNFEGAAYVEVTVEDEDGLDITSKLLPDRTTIRDSSGSLRLDIPGSDLDSGTYTVTVEGAEGRTDLSYASRSVTFTLR